MRLFAALLVAATVGCGCNDGGHGAETADAHQTAEKDANLAPAADAGRADATIMPAVILMPEGKPEVRVTVAIARTSEEQRRGLMYVQHLPVDAGMIFLMGGDAVQQFWMKNTLIPLDMIFIRSDFTIAGIVQNATPLSLDPRGVTEKSRYVLEVNGGWSAAHGISKDNRVRFEGVLP